MLVTRSDASNRHNKVRIYLDDDEALTILQALQEYLHIAESSDADGCSGPCQLMIYELMTKVANSVIADEPRNAVLNLLGSKNDILSGNACNNEGQLYPDTVSALNMLKMVFKW